MGIWMKTPTGASSGGDRTLEEWIQDAQEIANNWKDVLCVHQLVGIEDNGYGCYCNSVYSTEYTVKTERPITGNFTEVFDDNLLVARFRCAEGLIKHDVSDAVLENQPMYLFERLSKRDLCKECNSSEYVVICNSCIEKNKDKWTIQEEAPLF